jgi:hypothetical protein
MTDGAIDQGRQGSSAERRVRHAPRQGFVAQGHAAAIARVRPVRTSSLPVPGESGSFGGARRSLRGYGAHHSQASCGNSPSSPGIREEQWSDDRDDRDTSIGCVSRFSEKAWLSRAPDTAHFKSTSTMGLIVCTIRSSRRFTTFWCHVASAPSACA